MLLSSSRLRRTPLAKPGATVCAAPALPKVDLALFKNIPITERFKLQFRAEGFNIANRANFANPNATVTAGANFGRITQTRASPLANVSTCEPRVFQFGLKVQF